MAWMACTTIPRCDSFDLCCYWKSLSLHLNRCLITVCLDIVPGYLTLSAKVSYFFDFISDSYKKSWEVLSVDGDLYFWLDYTFSTPVTACHALTTPICHHRNVVTGISHVVMVMSPSTFGGSCSLFPVFSLNQDQSKVNKAETLKSVRGGLPELPTQTVHTMWPLQLPGLPTLHDRTPGT